MRRERAAKVSAEAITIVPVPKETNEAVPDVRPTSPPPPPDEVQYFSCCVDRLCRSVDDQLSNRQVHMH